MKESPDPIAQPAERARCAGRIDTWTAELANAGRPVLAAGRDESADRWFVRMQGSEKDVVTSWLTLRQRTLRYETHMMPAPETDRAATYAYLLRRNAGMGQLRFALGTEDAVLVVGEIAIAEVGDQSLDQLVGGSLAMVDDCYPTAMSLGHASWFRRRPPRPG